MVSYINGNNNTCNDFILSISAILNTLYNEQVDDNHPSYYYLILLIKQFSI